MTELAARLDALEIRLSFQDDTIDALNREVSELQAKVMRLERALALLARRQAELAANLPDSAGEEPPPPHY